MAVSVDWNTGTTTTRTCGIYGIYNSFVGLISRTAGTVYKLQFQIKVTSVYDSNVTYTKNVDAVGLTAVCNPVQFMQEKFFKGEYTGQTENTAYYAYSGIQIEIGETYATAADEAPTFQGYDTDDTFYFYNGKEIPEVAGQLIGNNYREPAWYTETPHLLPKTKKTLYLFEDDVELLSMPSYLNIYPETVAGENLENLITENYEEDGTLISTDTIDLTARPDLVGTGYWNIDINSIFAGDTYYKVVYCQWESGEGLIDSEEITIYRSTCNPKDDNYRLRWLNRYGGEEYQNFSLKHDKGIIIKRGKEVLSDGIDYAATSFEDISNVNNPNLREYATTYRTEWTLRTGWLTNEEINSLAECYTSNGVLLFNPEIATTNNEEPVIVLDNSYRILEVKDGLQKAEIRIKRANLEPNQIQ